MYEQSHVYVYKVYYIKYFFIFSISIYTYLLKLVYYIIGFCAYVCVCCTTNGESWSGCKSEVVALILDLYGVKLGRFFTGYFGSFTILNEDCKSARVRWKGGKCKAMQ